MIKEDDEALNNMPQKNTGNPARECIAFKVLKDNYAYGEPSKRKLDKGEKAEEVLECHRLHLFKEGLSSKNTQFSYPEDAAEQKDAKGDTNGDDDPVLTELYEQDKFQDGRRRIDVVLVAVDDDSQPPDAGAAARIYFLESVLKAGLNIETEPGILPIHKNLVFIKIHAPNTVLDEYNRAFASKKYFRDNHLRFIQPGLTTVGRLLRCTRIPHERELISIVRDQYQESLRLSNEERSLIVYKILLELPFGEHANYIGLNRLLDRRVFLDAYALHDGPHFVSPKQDWKTINARQILFYNWVGKRNVFKVHPLNLIREYFGEKIGMYFAFYEFYNHALIIAALFGLILFIASINDATDNAFVDDVCQNKNNTYICPRCKVFEACRFIKLTNLCYLAKIHRVLDSPVTVVYAICLVVWATSFYILWKRKESFWIWLWEINTDRTKEIFRPEYSMYHAIKPRSLRTGLLQQYNIGVEKYGRKIVVTVICLLMFAGPVALLIPLFMYKQMIDRTLVKDKAVSLDLEDIAFIVIFAIKFVFFVQIFGEFVFRIPVHYITKLENHRTYESYTRSFSFKTFAASFVLTFPIMFYYAWLKGVEYFMPVRIFDGSKAYVWATPRAYFSLTHCGPFTCLDEVFFVLLATIFIRHIAMPFLAYLKGCFFITLTDYNQGARITKSVLSWEREYRLEPVTEEMMARKLNFLAMQFALVTLVGTVFPLAPLLVLIRNICHIRYEARMFVQCRRRPLLLAGAGLGVWTPILQYLAFFSVPTNALTLALTTKTATRMIYMQRVGSMKGFLHYSLFPAKTEIYSNFMTSRGFEVIRNYINAYEKENFVPKMCHFPGFFTENPREIRAENFHLPPHRPVPNAEYQQISFGAYFLYCIFAVAGLLYAFILNSAVPPYTSQLNKIMEIEVKMKKAFVRMSKK